MRFSCPIGLFALIAFLSAPVLPAASPAWIPFSLPAGEATAGDWLCPRDYLSEAQGEALLAAAADAFDSVEDWEAYQRTAKAEMRTALGFSPWPRRTDLRARIFNPRTYDGYQVETVVFEPMPGLLVGGSLYRPSRTEAGRHAGIVSFHGHTRSPDGSEAGWAAHGRFTEQAQTRAAELARLGAVTLNVDSYGYGDGWTLLGPDAHRDPLAMRAQLWTGMRALDLLESLPEVDPERLGATGESGGGTQTILLAALDDRVAASAPVVMVSSYFFGGCPCESGLPIHRSATHFVNNAMIAGFAAPRPQLLVSVGADWTRLTPRVEYPFLERIYGLYGESEQVKNAHFEEEGHDYGASKRRAAYDFFHSALGLDSPASLARFEAPAIEKWETMRALGAADAVSQRALRSNAAIENRLDALSREDAVTLFLIGDSTMAEKRSDRRPETGWGEALGAFFEDGVLVENHAVNGRSSKSFRDEGRWDVVKDRIRPGDYVLIQFGHNDQKDQDPSRYAAPWTDYARNLRRYARETRDRGGEPILLTSICRRRFEDGRLVDTHGDYPRAVRMVAEELGATLIDMERRSRSLLTSMGAEESRSLFLHLEPGEHPNYPEGKADDTHLSPEGARRHAKLFVEGLTERDHPLADRLAATP